MYDGCMETERAHASEDAQPRVSRKLTTAREVATALKISDDTVWRWIRDGKIPGVLRVGGSLRIPAQWLEDFLEGKV